MSGGRLRALCLPLRGQARSHRYEVFLTGAAHPVGAGLPAKGPEQTPPLHDPDDNLRALHPATAA
ncbi:hypothetical protein F3J45_19290 [Pantoea sp. Ap-967]|nr:hypothetical protein [Pantoea sp. Ap-967]